MRSYAWEISVTVEKQHIDNLLGVKLVAEALSEQAQSRLIGTLVHKLRTPIATLKMNLEALSTRAPTFADADKSRLERIQRAGQRLQGIIADLEHQDLVSGRGVSLEMRPHPAAELVRRSVERARGCFPEREMDFNPSKLRPGVMVTGDEALLEFALANVVGHAAISCGQGGLLEIACASPPRKLEVSVSYCVAKGRFPEILDSASHAAGLGVGFRLYFAGAIAEAHGGELLISNKEDGRASASFSLPINDERPTKG